MGGRRERSLPFVDGAGSGQDSRRIHGRKLHRHRYVGLPGFTPCAFCDLAEVIQKGQFGAMLPASREVRNVLVTRASSGIGSGALRSC